ncbi:MAG TPA: hypothetical protein VHM26_18095 [Chitinophagaceae bacterium]|jgi:hypothetical protein|nr:hypothetical protein [Chitinophagaceae bacterium]
MVKRRTTTKGTKLTLYAASKYLSTRTRDELGLRIPFDVYLQDPYVSKNDPKYGFDEDFFVNWEPGIASGPTSARFAIVDYNADTGTIIPMATWDEKQEAFLAPDKTILDKKNAGLPQFHQVNVWAVLQRALTFFEEPSGLGRRIPFGFEGNRLIVLPHAGYGQNAYYDRKSKSLQFYYFDKDDERIYTCLSTDIINHEFGHAVLDGIRPYYYESSLVQTGAFHEFIGDLTAILIIFRNNNFRKKIAKDTKGNITTAAYLTSIADEFGNATTGKPYLRTALNKLTMADIDDGDGPHKASEVLTGAMFDIIIELTRHYINTKQHTHPMAFYFAVDRMQRMAIQPLDLLPPVDVTFRDYALAVLRAEELSNPTDPHNYYEMILKVFVKRGILDNKDKKNLLAPRYVYDAPGGPDLDVYHDIGDISRSRATAYRFLDDNRDKLFIPANQDVIVADLYDANKYSNHATRLPRQIILEYIWREDVVLNGKKFGEFDGQNTSMLCGGTLVFDDKGNILSWFRKPGSSGGKGEKGEAENAAGKKRLSDFTSALSKRIRSGQVGAVVGSNKGMVGSLIPPVTVTKQDGVLKFELSPHLNLSGEDHEHYKGGKQWQVSS